MNHEQTITEILSALDSKEYSCLELTQHYLQRIDSSNTHLNAFISVNHDSAIKQANAMDKARSAGNAPRLAGLPIAHKDIFCTKGIKTSCGSQMLDNFIAPYDLSLIHI